MVSLRQLFFVFSLFSVFLLLSSNKAQADSPLNQPPILSSNALHKIAQFNQSIPDHVVMTTNHRLIALFPRYIGNTGFSLAVQNSDKSWVPYPNAQWNMWSSSKNHQNFLTPQNSFIGLTSLNLTEDGNLWILDSGVEKIGSNFIPNSVKLIQINTKTNQVIQIIPINASTLRPKSFLSAISVYGHYAYIADMGNPAIIVMNLTTKTAKRLLDDSPSLYSRRPIIVNKKVFQAASDGHALLNVNQLAISPDGKRLYYQAASGPLYLIDTNLLNNPEITASELVEAMTLWYDTPSSGGITCAPDGTLYISDIATGSIYRFTTKRILTKLITDSHLKWPAHPYIDHNQLYLSAAQLDQTRLLHKQSTIQWPVEVFSLSLPTSSP